MRRDERRRQREWQGRRTKSRARHLAKARRGRDEVRDPIREDFACEFLCAECGYLMRERQPRCPSCKGDGVWDLTDTETAERLRALEEDSRSEVPVEVRAGSWVFSILTGLGVAAGTALLIDPFAALVLLFAVPLGLGVSIPRGAALLWRRAGVRALPSRWRLPSGPAAPARPGHVVAAGLAGPTERLKSPITQTPCIAWRVVVDFDIPGDARPRERVIDECESGDATAGDHHLPANSYLFEATSTRLGGDRHAIHRYLRTRGLFASDGDFGVYESVLREGEFVEVCGAGPALVRRPVPVAT